MGALVGAALIVIAGLGALLSRSGAARRAAEARIAELEREAAGLLRSGARLQQEHQFLAHFLTEFPHLTRDLNSLTGERRIPGILLHIVQRTFEPRQVLVLVRRKRQSSDLDGAPQLVFVVAAAAPLDGPVRVGTELAIGQGEIGFVAEVQRAMARPDFEAQPAATRQALRRHGLPGFEPDLVAPMVVGEKCVGVIAVAKARQDFPHAKAALRAIAHIGALAVHDITAYSEMKVTADIDGLTQVYNKHFMTRTLADALLAAERDLKSVSIFLFDIDNFKNYNDVNGHVAGDRLLQRLARLVQDNTRKENVFGRFGGEEFLLVLTDTGSAAALRAAENLRALIAQSPFAFAERQPLGVLSVSGGVAEYPRDARDSTALLRAADAALYQAKQRGRNRVCRVVTHDLGEAEAQVPAHDNVADGHERE